MRRWVTAKSKSFVPHILEIFYFEHVHEPPNLVLPVFERSEPFKKCYERAVFRARTEVRTTLF